MDYTACPDLVVIGVSVGSSGFRYGITSPSNVANVNTRVSFGGPGGPKFDLLSLRPTSGWEDGHILQVGLWGDPLIDTLFDVNLVAVADWEALHTCSVAGWEGAMR